MPGSRIPHRLGAPLAVVDALADPHHAAGGGVVGGGGLLHLGAPHAAEDQDGRDGLADVHAADGARVRGGGGG